MRPQAFRIRLLLLGSALALVSSCGAKQERPVLHPPADLLSHPARPAIGTEALTSEQAYEGWRDDVDDWGKGNADIIDRACWWFQDAGVTLTCAPREAKP